MRYLILLLAILLAACEKSDNLDKPRQFFSANKIGSGADFGLMKRGSDHVATVHGFVDDLSVCMKFAEVLNREEPDTYSCVPLNH